MTDVPAKYKYSGRQYVHTPFGVTDSKGRDVGAFVITETIVISPDPDTERKWCRVADPKEMGTWFSYTIQSTRDGAEFGASAKTSRFRDEAERDRKALAALIRSQRRATKKCGG